MKPRSLFLTSILLLTIGSTAGAGPAAQPAGPAESSELETLFSGAAPAVCAAAKLPSPVPAPTQKAATCGSCSDSFCQGKSPGTTCRVQGSRIYRCQYAYITCDYNDCQCWNGPLP